LEDDCSRTRRSHGDRAGSDTRADTNAGLATVDDIRPASRQFRASVLAISQLTAGAGEKSPLQLVALLVPRTRGTFRPLAAGGRTPPLPTAGIEAELVAGVPSQRRSRRLDPEPLPSCWPRSARLITSARRCLAPERVRGLPIGRSAGTAWLLDAFHGHDRGVATLRVRESGRWRRYQPSAGATCGMVARRRA
jgi:hypothetical protein